MSYTQPPPDYGSASSSGKPTAPDQEPLLSHEQDEPQRKPQQAQQERPAWQGTDDMSEDFDIGVSVSQSSWEVRLVTRSRQLAN